MEETWRRIMALLSEHAPVTAREIRPPAPASDLDHLRNRVGFELPPELLAWWALMDGVDDQRVRGAGYLIPKGYLPLR
ncbi:hypothetical protein [Amycolatopsis sp. WAC 01416]|uniref:hypothetical protein n=1 Tax=Amycolatopsis sp. WAC 01416 TaxID=2203196 RepID=UPI001F3A7333|nr:hypothetical protein [Amycolatopsis sp. WAC 01416]